MVNEELKQLVTDVRYSLSITQGKLAEMLQVKPSYLSDMINGRVTCTPETLIRIKSLINMNNIHKDDSNTNINIPKDHQIPLMPISARGGTINYFSNNMREFSFERIISPIKGAAFATTIAGNEMAPEYPAGSQIFVKEVNNTAFLEWGKVYLMDTINGPIIRKVMPTPNKDTILCLAINPEYPPFELELSYINAFYRVMIIMSLK